MNILYLANIRLPTEKAHGLQIMKTCEALADAGARVELIVPVRKNPIGADAFDYYRVARDFRITTVCTPDLVRFGPLGFLVSALWFSEKARWLDAFRTADAIYSRDTLVLAQYLLLGRPFVFEAHTRPSFVSRIVARRAHKVIAISAGLRDAYARAGIAVGKIVIAQDAVDEHLFDGAPMRADARAILGLSIGRRIALYAGHLYARKGADTLAQAAAALPEILFIFVGGTDADIAWFKARWGNAKNILVVGHVPHERIPIYLRAADLLVLPNSARNDDSARYTSPMKLFEYMASGTPIIASDVPSLREIVDESLVYFFTPDDSQNLAECIEKVLGHPEQANEKAQKTLRLAKTYSWDARAQHILEFLHSAAQNVHSLRARASEATHRITSRNTRTRDTRRR